MQVLRDSMPIYGGANRETPLLALNLLPKAPGVEVRIARRGRRCSGLHLGPDDLQLEWFVHVHADLGVLRRDGTPVDTERVTDAPFGLS